MARAVVVVEASRGLWSALVFPLTWILAAVSFFELRSLVGGVVGTLVLMGGYGVSLRSERRWFEVGPERLRLLRGRLWGRARPLGELSLDGPAEVVLRFSEAREIAEVSVVSSTGRLSVRVPEQRVGELAEQLREALLGCGVLVEAGATLKGRIVERWARGELELRWRARPESFAREETSSAWRAAFLILGLVVGSVLLLRAVGVCGGVLVGGLGVWSFGALRDWVGETTRVTRLKIESSRWSIERSQWGLVQVARGEGKPRLIVDAGVPRLEAGGRSEVLADLSEPEARWLDERLQRSALPPGAAH